MSNSANNKRIAKNTALLYVRMLLTMGVSLYTSRVVLNTLGVEDFGIYNVVGGVIVLFSFINSALTQATQRFLTIEIGNKNLDQFKKIFNLSILVYFGLSVAIIVLAETIGLWFLNNILNIPPEKIEVSNVVYQFTILSFVVGLLKTPYNAVIIAHEKMSFYAYISIVDVILKLLVVYALVLFSVDKLVLYSSFIFLVTFINWIIYYLYCKLQYSECKFQFYWNKQLFMELLQFSSWSLFGSVSVMATNQGVSFLLNIFFGVVTNAAMGIANQVSGAANQIVSNFQMAFNPQIVKIYTSGNSKDLQVLIFRSAKISFFLMLFISFPLLFEMENILTLWLKNVPEYTVVFCKLTIVSLLIETLSGPLWMAVQATGEIRRYQLIISSIFWANLLGSYILFLNDFNPESAFIVRCGISFILLFVRIYLLKLMIHFPARDFIVNVVFRVALLSVVAYLPIDYFAPNADGFSSILKTFMISSIIMIVTIYFLGLQKTERSFFNTYLKLKILH